MSDFTVRSCFRPLTPDDVAIISEVPGFKNVFINAGHGSRGMSYCFGAADIMSQIMEGSKDFEDYSVKRYYFIWINNKYSLKCKKKKVILKIFQSKQLN